MSYLWLYGDAGPGEYKFATEKQSLEDNEIQHMKLFVVTYEDERVLAREVLHGLQPLKRNKTKFIQVVFCLKVVEK